MSKLALPPPNSIDTADKLQQLEGLLGKAQENLENALSPNTRRMYKHQWNKFQSWCATMGLPSFPAKNEVLLVYLTNCVENGAALSTITQAYCAIREHHRIEDIELPTLEGKLYRSWTGARKKASNSEVEKALALRPEDLKTITNYAQGPQATRDRALLLVGWCAALRRDEIVNLDREDIQIESEGLRIKIKRSKTDQFGAGQEVGIARSGSEACPLQAWKDYLSIDPEEEGPAFRSRTYNRLSGEDVSRILRKRMRQAGLDYKGYSAHSLRAGCITAAAKAGHSLEAIQRQSRHKSLEVLLGYIRTANLLTDNVTKGLL